MAAQHKYMTRFCVGCGICLGICPVNSVRLKAEKGIATVSFDHSRCTNCALCAKTCPGLFNLYRRNTKSHDTLGKINKVFFGYSTDDIIRYHAASGGVITSLLLHMLKREIVDEVLVVKMDKLAPNAILTHDKDEIISAQGSIYFKTFSLSLLPKLLSDLKKGKRVSIVGLPCQISMLKEILKNFEEQLFYIGLICNHVNEPWYLSYVFRKYLPQKAKPLAIGPRKDGWPGGIRTLFKMPNGDFQELTIPRFWGLLPSLNISAPLGCLMCADHLASSADMVAGDAWHPKYIGKDSSGVSILIVRTDKGLRLLNSAIKDGALHVEETSLLSLVIAQSHNIIEGSQYAPFKQKLFQHRIATVRELREIDKTLIALLAVTNQYVLKDQTIRRLLDEPSAERLLKIVLRYMSRRESTRLLDAIESARDR